MGTTKKVHSDQRGFASLVVALVMILILSLLTVGFARLARHEQQSSLDKQLATQAYYAAETGINDLVKAIPAINTYNISPTAGVIDPNVCLTDAQLSALGLRKTVDAVTDISYTCALVNLKPYSIVYDGIDARAVRQTAFSTSGTLDSLTVSWRSHAPEHTTFKTGTMNLTPQADWGANTPGVIQVSITPLNDVSRDALIGSTFTAYLYPSKDNPATPTLAYKGSDDSGNGPIYSGHCSTTAAAPGSTVAYPCNATISGIQHGGGPGQYYMIRVISYYDDSDVSVNNLRDAAGTQLTTVDAQAQIDVTGKAKNVLKRIQVRSPLHTNFASVLPSAAIDSQGTCKRVATTPQTSYDAGSVTPDTPAGWGNLCDMQIVR